MSDSDKVLLSQDYILQVARLFDYKDHFTMLDIYSQLKQKGVKEKLYIIGDGPNYSKLEERIKDLVWKKTVYYWEDEIILIYS